MMSLVRTSDVVRIKQMWSIYVATHVTLTVSRYLFYFCWFPLLVCQPVVILEDNSALRHRLDGVHLPKVKTYTVPSDGYGMLPDV